MPQESLFLANAQLPRLQRFAPSIVVPRLAKWLDGAAKSVTADQLDVDGNAQSQHVVVYFPPTCTAVHLLKVRPYTFAAHAFPAT